MGQSGRVFFDFFRTLVLVGIILIALAIGATTGGPNSIDDRHVGDLTIREVVHIHQRDAVRLDLNQLLKSSEVVEFCDAGVDELVHRV